MSEKKQKNKSEDNTADREIVITRLIRASPQRVWRAWSDPTQLVHWWGPKGFTNTFHEFHFKPGGTWRFTMHGPDGTDYPNFIRFEKIEPYRTIVHAHGIQTALPEEPGYFHATITFEPRGSKGENTLLTLHSIFRSKAERDAVVEKYRAIEGGNQTLDRLEKQLGSAVWENDSDGKPQAMRIVRYIHAPVDRVFSALTDPKQIAKWFAPDGFSIPHCTFDAKPGGPIRLDMQGPKGTEFDRIFQNVGRVDQIHAPHRLVFTLAVLDESGKVALENQNTVDLEESGGITRLTLSTRIRKMSKNGAFYLQGMDEGWMQSLDHLMTFVSENNKLNQTKGGLKTMAQKVEPFIIQRLLDAPRELVWAAFTDPNRMKQWWGPKGVTIIASQMDFRVGGTYLYGMRTPDGKDMWGKFVYREITPPKKLVLVNSFSDANGGITRHPLSPSWPLEMLTTMTFEEESGKTHLTIQWSPINPTETEAQTFEAGRDSMKGGWSGTFEQLESYLAKTQSDKK